MKTTFKILLSVLCITPMMACGQPSQGRNEKNEESNVLFGDWNADSIRFFRSGVWQTIDMTIDLIISEDSITILDYPNLIKNKIAYSLEKDSIFFDYANDSLFNYSCNDSILILSHHLLIDQDETTEDTYYFSRNTFDKQVLKELSIYNFDTDFVQSRKWMYYDKNDEGINWDGFTDLYSLMPIIEFIPEKNYSFRKDGFTYEEDTFKIVFLHGRFMGLETIVQDSIVRLMYEGSISFNTNRE